MTDQLAGKRGQLPAAMLAEVYPALVATWHPGRNGSLTPDRISAKAAFVAWWLCPAGHEWEEKVSARAAMAKWKNGDVAACRQCTGFRVPYTYPGCGCTVKVTAEAAERHREKAHPRCFSCHSKWWRENEVKVKAEMSKAAKGAAAKAGKLLDQVAVPADVPPPLVTEWRFWAAKTLQGAFGAEAALEGRQGEVSAALVRVTAQAAAMPPTEAEAGRASAAGGVLKILDHAHWAEGWLHHLTGRRPRPVGADELDDMAEEFSDWFAGWADAALVEAQQAQGVLSTAAFTRLLTKQVGDLGRSLEGMVRAQPYRELRLPVVPPGATRYGRLDTVICQPGAADIVVEIDSAPNASSAAKLAFARDAGAVPIWIRFGKGSIDAPDGVAVIDLRAVVSGIQGTAAEPVEGGERADIIDRVQRAIPELDHCTYYELDYQGETVCVAVDFSLRGVWALRNGRLRGLSPDADPELAALLLRNGIRL
ncbi:zinc-ribbon domain-containing protein [Kitasatospora sp. NBC_01300]|uniref:zinc-ribbon domain-containing protein n=1 Tax=Kitasatospora sp. NBC_01300 TaxID=2903574 RepID=UPI002F91910C|nr:zinc-ribbon domain-containing protein [Kitasatospora sp. NBC_01300]